MGIKHRATLVEHPQRNGQTKAGNKVILKEVNELEQPKVIGPKISPLSFGLIVALRSQQRVRPLFNSHIGQMP